ncbi:peptidoglycan DD-metalloendopeptidase family protein [Antrihabitans stalagmiti]|nr:peptidoglycan DD-metalloendopeptidase family protein [Antrihabitans stalagmiti]
MKTAAGLAGAVVLLPLLMIAVLLAVVFVDDKDACTATRPVAAVVQGDPGPAPAERGSPAPSGERTYPLAAGTYSVTDHFGTRGGSHQGVDYAAAAGTAMFAAAPGNVVASGPASGFGQWIIIDSVDADGSPFSTVYGHIFPDDLRVKVGDVVKAGDHIAAVGYNGEVQPPGPGGAHLHFEVWPGGRLTGGSPIDPESWLGGAATPKARAGGKPSTPSPAPVCEDGFGTQGGQLADGVVPPELDPWYRKAGSLCPQITPSLLAAQGKQESGFQRGLSSPDNAQGLAQFIPTTAIATAPDGRPYIVDADGNGAASVWDDGDAIVGQGRYMCALAAIIDGWKADGRVQGDTPALALGAYNAGEGSVLASGGIPNQIPRHFSETQPYIRIILDNEPNFRAAAATGRFVPSPSSPVGGQIVDAARQYLGTPYVYGGGGPQGPSNGGLDCSGLTSAAVHAASGGAVTLPRTSEQQWSVGPEIPIDQAQPGDLVFGEWGSGGPGHVGIASGNGQMIHAPQPGDVVKEAPVQSGMRARRVA